METPVRTLAITTLAAVAISCSGGSTETATNFSPQVDEFFEDLGDDVPEVQREALEDGVVSFTEYKGAYLRTIDCLRADGLRDVGPSSVNRGRFLSYSYSGDRGDSNADAACRHEHLEVIDRLWLLQAVPSDSEMEGIAVAYAACLESGGVAVADSMSLEDVDQLAAEVLSGPNGPAVMACAERFSLGIFISHER